MRRLECHNLDASEHQETTRQRSDLDSLQNQNVPGAVPPSEGVREVSTWDRGITPSEGTRDDDPGLNPCVSSAKHENLGTCVVVVEQLLHHVTHAVARLQRTGQCLDGPSFDSFGCVEEVIHSLMNSNCACRSSEASTTHNAGNEDRDKKVFEVNILVCLQRSVQALMLY